MKKLILPFILLFTSGCLYAQKSISDMKWGLDFKLHIKLSNDSNYVMDVKGLYHTGGIFVDTSDQASTYYPVALDQEFINYVKNNKLVFDPKKGSDSLAVSPVKTLWSALHADLGGGYIHFINCLIYSLESQQLSLIDPIMKRPVSRWRPKPMTESYRRTQKWDYYIPFNQKQAQKEFRSRKRENDLRDLQGVPGSFIQLFNSTSQREYNELKKEQKRNLVAQIDLVRLLLGAKYLGDNQIQFIRSKVISSVLRYSLNTLPSVIIFDDYNAAVALSLDKTGYKAEYMVFRDQEMLSPEERTHRINTIKTLIQTINKANDRVFQSRLEKYYQRN